MTDLKDPKTTQELMDEADELIRNIYSDVILDLKDEQRMEFEKDAQELERLKSVTEAQKNPDNNQEHHTAAEGIHEAILDIVKAMQDWKNKIF